MTAASQDPRWHRIKARDKTADCVFWYSVCTTGVYCRPSCASRPALPRNVAYHATAADARAAGLRPCLRCNPDGLSAEAQQAVVIARTCRMIEAAEAPPPLAALAQAADLSPSYFHRLFKAQTGVTPRAYAANHRAERVKAGLGQAATVTEAIYDAGFGSNGRFYAASNAILGMTPSRYRSGGAQEVLRFAAGQCSLGAIVVASSERGVAAILIGDDAEVLVRDLQDRFGNARLEGGDAAYEQLVAQVVGFVDQPRIGLHLPLDIRGTAFQQRVWQALRAIPAGQTATYAQVAARIGAPAAVRAVAGACAANLLAVAIPCHRVVRQNGALSGYRWGLERKHALIERERIE